MHDFVGRWRIERMETWTQEFVDLQEPGFFEFGEIGLGSFVFGTIRGAIDVRVSLKEPLLEFSWLGSAEGNELCGRGNFFFSTPEEGVGTFFVHSGGQSGVSIRRET